MPKIAHGMYVSKLVSVMGLPLQIDDRDAEVKLLDSRRQRAAGMDQHVKGTTVRHVRGEGISDDPLSRSSGQQRPRMGGVDWAISDMARPEPGRGESHTDTGQFDGMMQAKDRDRSGDTAPGKRLGAAKSRAHRQRGPAL